MNTKRIIFWIAFLAVLGLIAWGLVVAMNRPVHNQPRLGTPSDVTAADHVRGPITAPVTVIEYSDFQCPACALYYPVLEQLIASSTNVRVVYRNFPLYPLPHPNSMIAAQAAEAAGKQGKFWDMYHLIFPSQKTWADLSNEKALDVFKGYAIDIGLDMKQYATDFDSPAVKAKIDADRTEGDTLGINSTPTFFVNGKAVVNPQGYEAFKKIVDEAAR